MVNLNEDDLWLFEDDEEEPEPKPGKTRQYPTAKNAIEGEMCHTWVVAATIEVDNATAKYADFRGSFRVKVGQRVICLETYCCMCRRGYNDVADKPCEEKINNEHLIGGDQSVRAKRNKVDRPDNAVSVPASELPSMNRYGTDDYCG